MLSSALAINSGAIDHNNMGGEMCPSVPKRCWWRCYSDFLLPFFFIQDLSTDCWQISTLMSTGISQQWADLALCDDRERSQEWTTSSCWKFCLQPYQPTPDQSHLKLLRSTTVQGPKPVYFKSQISLLSHWTIAIGLFPVFLCFVSDSFILLFQVIDYTQSLPCSYLPFDKLTVFLVCYNCYECPCHPYVRVTLTRNWHDVASHWTKSCLLLIRYIPQSKNYFFIFKWLKSKLKVHTISWVSLSRNKIIQKAEQKHSLTGWLTLWGSHEL